MKNPLKAVFKIFLSVLLIYGLILCCALKCHAQNFDKNTFRYPKHYNTEAPEMLLPPGKRTDKCCVIPPGNYIVIKKRAFKITLRSVRRPSPKHLRKWHYSPGNDTYYRGRGLFGIPVKIVEL